MQSLQVTAKTRVHVMSRMDFKKALRHVICVRVPSSLSVPHAERQQSSCARAIVVIEPKENQDRMKSGGLAWLVWHCKDS